MSKKDRNMGKIPALRFIKSSTNWKSVEFGSLVSFKTTNSYSRDNLNYESGTVKNIHYGDIHTKFQTLFDVSNEEIPYINDNVNFDRISEENYCVEGDMIFADASEDLNDVGKSIEIIELNNEKVLSGLHTILARPTKKGNFQKGFLGYVFKSVNVRKQIKKESQGSKVLSINAGRLSKIIISYPDLDEQKKIATFLKLIDQRIMSSMKTIKDLTILKNSFAKDIFQQKIGFGENKNQLTWNKINFGKITNVISNRNKENLKLPIYSINNKSGFVPQGEQFDGVDSSNRGYDISLYKIIGENTFAYNPARINVGSIGYSGNLKDIIISSLYVCFQTTDEVNDEFLYHYLKTEIFRKEVLKNVEGGVRDYLFYENFSKIKIKLPQIQEQIKIANFLNALDKKIELETEILKKLEEQKHYFLQNLFV